MKPTNLWFVGACLRAGVLAFVVTLGTMFWWAKVPFMILWIGTRDAFSQFLRNAHAPSLWPLLDSAWQAASLSNVWMALAILTIVYLVIFYWQEWARRPKQEEIENEKRA